MTATPSLPDDARALPDAKSAPEIVAAMRQIDGLLALVGTPLSVTTNQPVPNELHNWDLIGPAMVFSAASCLLSIRYLAEAPAPKRDQDAFVLLRRLYEHAVDFAWIGMDPANHAPRWVGDDLKYRLKTDDDLIRLGRDGLPAEKRQEYTEYIARHTGLPQVLQMADAADGYWSTQITGHGVFPQSPVPYAQDLLKTQSGRWSLRGFYALIYRMGSANAHPTPQSLYDYVHPGGAPNKFTIGLNAGALSRYPYTLAPLVFSTMLLISEKLLGRPIANQVYAAFRTSKDG